MSATLNCCQLREWIYNISNKYVYPIQVKSGQNGEHSTSATYDYNTGAPLAQAGENNLSEWRICRKVLQRQGADGEQSGAGLCKDESTLEAAKFVESYSYFDGRGMGIRSASQTPDGWSVSAIEFDNLGRTVHSAHWRSTVTGTSLGSRSKVIS